MRRWLLALFSLQLFCSVSAFTFASADTQEPSFHTAVLVAEASTDSFDIAPKGAASALDPAHGGLMDELPECLDVAMREATVATPWNLPGDRLLAEWTPPALDGPQRPPRSLSALA